MKIRTDRMRWGETKAQNSLEITQHVTSRAQNGPRPPAPRSTPPTSVCPGQTALGVRLLTESLHGSKHRTRVVHRFTCTSLQGQASLPYTAASPVANTEPLGVLGRPGSGSHLAPPRRRSRTQRPASRKRGAASCAEQAPRSTPGSSRVAPGPRLRRTLAVSDNINLSFQFLIKLPCLKGAEKNPEKYNPRA